MEIDDIEEENGRKGENRFVITNRQISPEQENPILRSINFLQFINSDTIKNKKSIKEKLKAELISSMDRLNDLLAMINFSTMDKSPIQLKSLLEMQHFNDKKSKQKLQHINFLKKADHFSQSIQAFKSDLIKQNNICNKTQSIFKELLDLKEIGFYIEESFIIPRYNEGNVPISIEFHNKYIKNFANLIKIFKHKFSLQSNYKCQMVNHNQKFDLCSNFYNTFSKKYAIVFEFELHIDNVPILLSKECPIEKMLETLLAKTYVLYESSKYSSKINTYMAFYLKYLLYQFCKREIIEMIKSNKGNNIFTYKNMTFILTKHGNNFSVTCNFFNHLQFFFKCSKKEIVNNTNTNTNNDDMTVFNNTNSNTNSNTNTLNHSNNNRPPSHVENIIKIFFNNLLYDIKLNQNIKEFYNKITNNPSLADIIDYGILVKNIAKINHIFLQRALTHQIKGHLNQKSKYSLIMMKNINLNTDYTSYRFIMNKIYSSHIMTFKIEFNLTFNRNEGITFELKEPYHNQICIIEKDYYTIHQYKRFDLNFLFVLLDNLLI